MEIYRGIMATTHVDKHNERVDKNELERVASQINKHDQVMWLTWNHQSTLPPIGTVEKAWVEQLPDGEYGLFFEGDPLLEEEPIVVTEDLEITPNDVQQLELRIEGLGLSHDPRNFHDADISRTIEELSKDVPIEHKFYVRKSEIPQSVVWVVVAFIGGSIAGGFLNRVGEVLADKTLEITKPLLAGIGKKLSSLMDKTIQRDKPDYIFIVQIPGANVNVEGALESPAPAVLEEACEKLPELCAYAIKVLSQNRPDYFQDLKFLYNHTSHRWEINFLTVKRTHKVIKGKRYYILDHPLRLRYDEELRSLKELGKE